MSEEEAVTVEEIEKLVGTAAADWNTPEEKAKYQKVRKVRKGGGKNGAKKGKEVHEREDERYTRLSEVDWKANAGNEGRDGVLAEGYFCTYGPAEVDMRMQAEVVYKMTGQLTMLHMHAPGEACIEPVYGNTEGTGTERSGAGERLRAGCEWIGSKK